MKLGRIENVVAIALIAVAAESQAFIPKYRIADEVRIADEFIIFQDEKTNDFWKVDTDCEIKLGEKMHVKTAAKQLKENVRLSIKSEQGNQVCRITDISKL